jgi:putative ABC transport system substrate-binding protein
MLFAGWLFHQCFDKLENRKKGSSMLHKLRLRQKEKKEGMRSYKIAVLMPKLSPPVEEIRNGFVHEMTKDDSAIYDFVFYDAQGSRTLLRSQVEEVVDSAFDLVYSIGMQCTMMFKEISTKKNCLVPVFFTNFKDPVEKNIVASEQSSGNNFTGIAAREDFDLLFSLVTRVKNDVKNALIVYDPSAFGGHIVNFAKEVEQILSKKKIRVKFLEVFDSADIQQRVPQFIGDADALITLRDGTTLVAIESLVKMCNQHHVTLIASDLDSVHRGAAIGFGFKEFDTGVLGAKRARPILVEGKKPTDIPVVSVSDEYRILINSSTMKEQNLNPDPNILFLLKNGNVI